MALWKTAAPYVGLGAVFNALVVTFGLLYLFETQGVEAASNEARTSIALLAGAIVALVPFLTLCLVVAWFQILREERQDGVWREREYIYANPQPIVVLRIEDDQREFRIGTGLPVRSHVRYEIELQPSSHLWNVVPVSIPMVLHGIRAGSPKVDNQGEATLTKRGELVLRCYKLDANAMSVIARVKIHSWEFRT